MFKEIIVYLHTELIIIHEYFKHMLTLILVFALFALLAFIIASIELTYYDKKLPDESLEEINDKISNLEERINKETNIIKQEELLDYKEYWERERGKLIKFKKKRIDSDFGWLSHKFF